VQNVSDRPALHEVDPSTACDGARVAEEPPQAAPVNAEPVAVLPSATFVELPQGYTATSPMTSEIPVVPVRRTYRTLGNELHSGDSARRSNTTRNIAATHKYLDAFVLLIALTLGKKKKKSFKRGCSEFKCSKGLVDNDKTLRFYATSEQQFHC
jgi:hypothetical protein